jgi:pimeloyl-ACP methyl ester carboxylesterase
VKIVLVVLLLVVGLVIVGMVVTYQLKQGDKLELNNAARSQLPGSFIELEDGVLSYYLRGPQDGEKVVLVHGFSTPKFVWDNTIDMLTGAGYRVLAYDHYGRGFSDRPKITYDKDLYTRELLNLLDALDVTEPVTLVGYSMGGGNVIGFAASYPQRVKKLILIAPVGNMPKPSGLMRLATLPVIGEWLMNVVYREALLGGIRKDTEAGIGTPNMLQNFAAQLRFKGYTEALLSTMRNYPMTDLSDDYARVGASGIPVYAIWGTADSIVPFSGAELAKQEIPGLELFPVEGAEHSVTYARAEVVNSILIDVLGRR